MEKHAYKTLLQSFLVCKVNSTTNKEIMYKMHVKSHLPNVPVSLALAEASASVVSILTPDRGTNSGTSTLAAMSDTALRFLFCFMLYISANKLAAENT